MAVALDDLLSSFQVKGASVPIADVVEGTNRTLDLVGTTTTPPRTASYSGVRGAEFRSSSFDASSPQALGTDESTGFDTDLYVSSKIRTFTWLARFRPSKSGLTAVSLTPVGGLFSATNMGATPWVFNQPCFALIRQAAGSSRVIVSVMGAILDTTIATQESGATSTEPSGDAAWQTIGVVVTGSTTVNNQIDSVKLVHVNASGIRRVYALGAHRAAALLKFTTNPTDGKKVSVNGRDYTFKTALLGSAAAGQIQNAGAVNPAPGYTLVVGSKTYRFVASVTDALRATAVLEWNSAASLSGSTKAITFVVSGYYMKLIFSSDNVKNQPAGSIDNDGYSVNSNAKKVFQVWHGDHDGNTQEFQTPATPNTGYDAGRTWANRRWSLGISSGLQDEYTATSYEDPVCGLNAGTAYNAIAVAVADPNATWVCRIKAGTGGASSPSAWASGTTYKIGDVVSSGGNNYIAIKESTAQTPPNATYWIQATDYKVLAGGTDAPAAYDVKIGATWADTLANLVAAINLSGTEGTEYAAGTAINPEASASANGDGTSIDLTSKKSGSAGNGETLTQSGATFTLVAFSGGVDGADADNILIGATAAESFNHLISALNLTGARGTDYGSPTTISADVTATLQAAGQMLLAGKASGAAGNSVTLTSDVTGVTFTDEFGDKAQTTLSGGTGAPPFTPPAGARPDNTDLRLFLGGWNQSAAATAGIFDGTVGDTALADRALTTEEIATWGIEPPAASTRDRGWYRAPHVVRIAAKDETSASWPVPRTLATGALNPRVEFARHGSRFAFRLISCGGAGRPMQCNALAFTYAREGGLTQAARGGYYAFPGFAGGVMPNLPKPTVPNDSMYDLLNMSLHQGVLRTRRGYRIMAGAGTGVSGSPCAFYDATNAAGQTWHLFFAGGTIYQYDNGNLTALDTDWPVNELPTCATVGQKTFFLSSAKQRVFIDGTFFDCGVTAPTDAPLFVSSTPADGAPTATAPGYEYVYTYFDTTKLTDSGPSPILLVLLPPGSPASSITLSFAAASGFDVNVWRRKRGDSNNVFSFVGTVADGAGTEFTDSSEIPGIETLDVFGAVAVTADFPDGTACASWNGKLVVWGDSADLRQLKVSELGDGERFWSGSIITCDGAVRGVQANEGRLVVFTDRTVEVIEGDFLRSPSGEIGITRHVIDTSRGSFGAFASCVGGGRIFWADVNGISTLAAGSIARDVSQDVSWPVLPIVQNAVDTSGTSVAMEYDYVSQQVWVCLTQADASDATKNRVTLVLDLRRRQWTVFDHSLSHVTRARDGIYGYLFVGSDYYGNVLELDVYDGDGCQGNESWYPASAAFSSFSATDKTITFSGGSFPTDGNGLRGVSVVLEDVSAGTFYRQVILSNTADTLTLDAIPAAIGTGDKAWIGQILGFFETPEIDAGTLDAKVLREIAVGLVDADSGAY